MTTFPKATAPPALEPGALAALHGRSLLVTEDWTTP